MSPEGSRLFSRGRYAITKDAQAVLIRRSLLNGGKQAGKEGSTPARLKRASGALDGHLNGEGIPGVDYQHGSP